METAVCYNCKSEYYYEKGNPDDNSYFNCEICNVEMCPECTAICESCKDVLCYNCVNQHAKNTNHIQIIDFVGEESVYV